MKYVAAWLAIVGVVVLSPVSPAVAQVTPAWEVIEEPYYKPDEDPGSPFGEHLGRFTIVNHSVAEGIEAFVVGFPEFVVHEENYDGDIIYAPDPDGLYGWRAQATHPNGWVAEDPGGLPWWSDVVLEDYFGLTWEEAFGIESTFALVYIDRSGRHLGPYPPGGANYMNIMPGESVSRFFYWHNGGFSSPVVVRTGSGTVLQGHTTAVLPTLSVTIDIRPGGSPNPVNPGSKGVIPVAILGTAGFDVGNVDRSTLAFGPDGAAPVRCSAKDVDDDGLTDLVCHFRTQETGIDYGDTDATLTGELLDNTPFEGSDSIKLVDHAGR